MALGDIGAFYEWVEREDPAISLGIAIKSWIDRLDRAAWQAPSTPIDELTVDGEYQIRFATYLEVDIWDQEVYATGKIDLIHVGHTLRRLRPMGPKWLFAMPFWPGQRVRQVLRMLGFAIRGRTSLARPRETREERVAAPIVASSPRAEGCLSPTGELIVSEGLETWRVSANMAASRVHP